MVAAVVLLTGAAAVVAVTDAFPWDTEDALGEVAAEPSTPAEAAKPPTPTPTPEPPEDAVFTLVAAGDVLLHQPVIAAARTPEGGYDFTPLLTPLAPWIAGADLALCHLEVPIAPAGTAPSGYPMFGAPAEIATALEASGWDGCSTASNHSLDRGGDGVTATLDALDAVGLGHVGTARTPEEAAAPQVYVLYRGDQVIKVAHIAATYGTNGLPIPAPWRVNLIDAATLIQQATAARDAGADVVVASVHCCVEYVSAPTDAQEQLAAQLAASGVVDLLIGHHAHVPQPISLLPGGPLGQGMWVAYGLGNFISNQSAECCTAATDSGLLMTATFRKPFDAPATVVGVEWSGVTVDRGGGYRVYPLSGTVQAGAGAGEVSAADLATRYSRVIAVVGTESAERVTPPTPTGDRLFVAPSVSATP
jgi:poly-gamma-glutamate synthesis protein (capsule biosynthesis protein)